MSDEEKAVVVLVAARLEFVETETMTADLPTHQEERLALTKPESWVENRALIANLL